jgi:hypothetical protein
LPFFGPTAYTEVSLSAFRIIFCPGAAGAAPYGSNIFPAGGKRGTTVKLTVSGSELGTTTGVCATGGGLTAAVQPGGDAATRTVDIVLARDAPLGIQQIGFYGSGGLSNVRFFDVGQWREQAQTGVTPIVVAPPVTVNGCIASSSSRNGVTFAARAGETLVCEIQGLRVLGQINDSWLKGYLEIVDSAGKVLVSSDGTADDYYRWDPVVAFTPAKDGEYTAWFRDLNWRGAPMAAYRLTVAAMPHAFGIFPLGGKSGTRLGTPMDPDLSLYDATGKILGSDDDSRGRDSRMERDLPAGEFTVRVRDIDDRGGIAFPYRLFIAPSQPRLHLVVTPDDATVPRGGSAMLTVRVERTDGFDGDVIVTVTGVPAGVTASALIVPKGQQEGKLTLTAAADAAMGPARLTVAGTGKAGKQSIYAVASASETYNIQGTAYQRDLVGPILLTGAK